jgi:transposase InsO family protein
MLNLLAMSHNSSLPKQWTRSVKSALVHAISLAQYALVYTRSWAGNSKIQRVRLAARANQCEQEVRLLRDEARIKDARMQRIPGSQRPHYLPIERLAILELRAARGWSLTQTAARFQVTQATIASWGKRLDEEGPDALVQMAEPVNKFSDAVHRTVKRLQTLCPGMGKVKIAQQLARAGLHLAFSTVGRMRKQSPKLPSPPTDPTGRKATPRVSAKYPNHVWHVDLTVVPTQAGFWASWLPFALPQYWPFCWWLAVCVDHYSRRAMGVAVFRKQPSARQCCHFLGGLVAHIGAAPKYLVSDSGTQFVSARFARWCAMHSIRQRFGAIGKRGSIAVVERFIRTLKDCCTRMLAVVPWSRRAFQRELSLFEHWYNQFRCHTTLKGATPDEVYFRRRPACRAPRFEPRAAWPRGSPCAKPQTLVKGRPGVELKLTVTFLA